MPHCHFFEFSIWTPCLLREILELVNQILRGIWHFGQCNRLGIDGTSLIVASPCPLCDKPRGECSSYWEWGEPFSGFPPWLDEIAQFLTSAPTGLYKGYHTNKLTKVTSFVDSLRFLQYCSLAGFLVGDQISVSLDLPTLMEIIV